MSTLFSLFISFIKIGTVGYGGGPSMVPLIKEEVVNLRHWMDMTDFVDIIAVASALPGPIATKLSAVVGYQVAGASGSVIATLAIVIPSAVALLILLRFVAQVKDNIRIKNMLKGLRPVVVAMLAYAAYDMSFSSLISVTTWIIAAITLALMIFTKIHPAIFIIAGATAGIVLGL